MRDLDSLFDALAKSAFRRRFRLGARELLYLHEKGLDEVSAQARELVEKRLASAAPHNDGRQTPFRGHPVFIAQHASATCCRSCLAKWHGIEAGKVLTEAERQHVVEAIRRWLREEGKRDVKPPADRRQKDLPF